MFSSGSNKKQATNILFYTFLVISGIGVLLFLLLGYEPDDTEKRKAKLKSRETDEQNPSILENAEDEGEVEEGKQLLGSDSNSSNAFSSFIQKLIGVVRLLGDPRMLLMVPVIFYSGLEQVPTFADHCSPPHLLFNKTWSAWWGQSHVLEPLFWANLGRQEESPLVSASVSLALSLCFSFAIFLCLFSLSFSVLLTLIRNLRNKTKRDSLSATSLLTWWRRPKARSGLDSFSACLVLPML